MITAAFASLDDIRAVMFDAEIFERTNQDGVPLGGDLAKADLSGWAFIGGYVRGRIASLFIVYGGLMHFWVLRPFRGHARALLDASFRLWPESVRIEIPELYPDVIAFAKAYGFVERGRLAGDFLKGGKYYDKIIMDYEVTYG